MKKLYADDCKDGKDVLLLFALHNTDTLFRIWIKIYGNNIN